MIIEFRCKNFRSIREEQAISFVASADHELIEQNSFSAEPGLKGRLLKSCVIYGANSSGKSNFLLAMPRMANIILNSVGKGDPNYKFPVEPYMLDVKTKVEPTKFEVSFIVNDIRYQYGFVCDVIQIHQEWLISYPKGRQTKIFERTRLDNGQYDYSFSSSFKGEKKVISTATRSNALFLSTAVSLNNEQLLAIYNWITKGLVHLSGSGLNYSAQAIHSDSELRMKMLAFMKFADNSIENLESEELTPDEVTKGASKEMADLFAAITKLIPPTPYYKVHSWHKVAGSDEPAKFLLAEESAGTNKFFNYLGPCMQALALGVPFIVDELDASLHPHMVRKLVGLFHNPEINAKGAQLLFSTHDTTLLDQTLFRRDQIWFAEKDSSNSSHLYSLLDYSPRKGEALQRGYLAGRYGAIPFFAGSEFCKS